MQELSNETRVVLAKLQIILDHLETADEETTPLDIVKHITDNIPELQKLRDTDCNPKNLESCICNYNLFSFKNPNHCYYCNAPIKTK